MGARPVISTADRTHIHGHTKKDAIIKMYLDKRTFFHSRERIDTIKRLKMGIKIALVYMYSSSMEVSNSL